MMALGLQYKRRMGLANRMSQPGCVGNLGQLRLFSSLSLILSTVTPLDSPPFWFSGKCYPPGPRVVSNETASTTSTS